MFNPIIKSYPEYAHLFSILGDPKLDDDLSKWFCWNFIQLRYDTIEDVDEALFFEKDIEECSIYRCSLLDKLIFEKRMFQSELVFREMISHYLKLGFYIVVVLDRFYFPFEKNYYQKSHRNHESLIYGIDEQRYVYLIQDFFDNIYSSREVSFIDFWNAYLNHYDYEIFDDEKIYLFKRKPHSDTRRLPFQLNKIQLLFQNYLTGEFSCCDNRTYGVLCYDKIIDRLRINKMDFRDFYLLFEHAKSNFIRSKLLVNLNFIKPNQHLEKLFWDVYNKSLILENSIIKQKIRHRQLPFEHIEHSLLDIKEKEAEAISYILSLINY